jgi:hypothetical protein
MRSRRQPASPAFVTALAGALLALLPLPGQVTVEIEATAEPALTIRIASEVELRGGEIGLAYDSRFLRALGVEEGPDLPAGTAISYDLAPHGEACAGEAAGLDRGIVIGWIQPVAENVLLPPGTYDVLRVTFERTGGEPPATCSAARLVRCLGVPEAPVRSVVTTAGGASIPIEVQAGTCVVPGAGGVPFRRGDADDDARVDLEDALLLLRTLFRVAGGAACEKALDANDDGALDVTDPVHLLRFLYAGSDPPAEPYTTCGRDPTPDGLSCLTSRACDPG